MGDREAGRGRCFQGCDQIEVDLEESWILVEEQMK